MKKLIYQTLKVGEREAKEAKAQQRRKDMEDRRLRKMEAVREKIRDGFTSRVCFISNLIWTRFHQILPDLQLNFGQFCQKSDFNPIKLV